ncbi:hypothetical protein [Aquimarina sp. MMG016]|uniref:hypothetical protein n=1 Tax=Aquimarina sp. MMG016 TaxID=2822690 RepID=UPI001B3A7AFC|nr:hypothetical protein [Aquimarina sp. MMG016]MBQ4819687.1 hypothetical protein [Aquimarina sp. MMG016]
MIRSTFLIPVLLLLVTIMTQSCGPIVISSRPDAPLPPWFYPNRVEVVRYVYFPDHNIYYDISLRHYIYFENDVWITVNVLPPRYQYINLNRTRYVRIRNYHGDNIRSYHSTNRYYNHSRSARSRYDRSRSSTTRNKDSRTRSNTDRSRTRNRDSIW